jgi:hypothetical protein
MARSARYSSSLSMALLAETYYAIRVPAIL